MLFLRKIDCYGQVVLASSMLLSIPFFYFSGVGLGLIVLGCWQIISAILNTYGFIDIGYKKLIAVYWTLCFADLILVSLFFFPGEILTSGLLTVILWIAMGAAVFIAGYYLRIYYKLIELISLRNELDGLTKSKH
jgi:hypothetical protein